MSVKTSLKFPQCLLQGDHITKIEVTLTCPPLTNSVVGLVFSNGLELSSADSNQIELIEGVTENDWVVDVKMFALNDYGSIDYEFYVDYSLDATVDAGKVTIYKGTVKVKKRVSNG